MNRFATTAAAAALGTALLASTACQAGGQAQESPPAPADDAAPAADVSDVTGATLVTSEGEIEVVLFPEDAPETVANFVELAEGDKAPNPETGADEFYDGTIFHRVIPDFMVQGGDPTGTGTGGPGYTFADEVDTGLAFDEPGKLAMANSGPDTNGSQFFLTSAPTPHLNGLHTIFGEIADETGHDVIAAISAVETGEADRPVEDIVLESVTIHRTDA